MIINDVFSTNTCGMLRILNCSLKSKVRVEFIDTGYTTTTTAQNIRKGQVKDYLHPTVCNIGYIGVGKFNKAKYPKIYDTWNSMLKRCYVSKYHPTYKDTTVCDEWLNYQNFAKWFSQNYIEGYHLDKDIKGTGKLYSPDNCIFVPQSINSIHARGTLGRVYKLVSPEGIIHTFSNQNSFCKDNQLDSGNLCRLINKQKDRYKGWTRFE